MGKKVQYVCMYVQNTRSYLLQLLLIFFLSLIINHSIHSGTQLPYIERGIKVSRYKISLNDTDALVCGPSINSTI